MDNKRDERDELIARYVRGECADEELIEINYLLEADPKAIHDFVKAAELERDLDKVFAGLPAARRVVARKAVPRAAKVSVNRQWYWVASIAALVILSLLIVASRWAASEPQAIARITTSAEGAILIRDGNESALKVFADLRIGDRIRVPAQGSVTAIFEDHTQMTIGSSAAGESQVLFEDYGPQSAPSKPGAGKRIRMDSGFLSANVAVQPSGMPMIVRTPAATAEILGTQLKLEVEKESTRLDVVEGKVSFLRLSDHAEAKVSSGQFVVAGADADFVPQPITSSARIIIAGDDRYELYFNGKLLGSRAWPIGVPNFSAQTFNVKLPSGKSVLAVKGGNIHYLAGLAAEIQTHSQRFATSKDWKVSTSLRANWTAVDYDDSAWQPATECGKVNNSPPYSLVSGFPQDTEARWIWSVKNLYSDEPENENTVYFRFSINFQPGTE